MDNSKIISFIKISSEIHNNKYNYDKIIFTKGSPLVVITCPTHGDFNQSRYSHLKGSGCKLCSIDSNTNKLKDTVKDFILKANKVHNNLYDYSKTVYKSSKEHVIIICSTHGEFLQKPNNHLSGYGCNLCGIEKSTEKQTLTLEEFIERSNKTHSNRYDYSNTVYTNFKTKVSVVCKEHGEFNQKPYDHMQGKGCSKCSQIVSSEENEVLEYIRSLKTSYKLLPSYRPLWLNRKELDIYVYSEESTNAVKIAENGIKYAKANGYDAVTTTLLYSIYQNHDFIKEYMEKLSEEFGIEFLYRDFRVGFREGQTKARELGLYMQKYCGCVFSEEDRYSKQISKNKEIHE